MEQKYLHLAPHGQKGSPNTPRAFCYKQPFITKMTAFYLKKNKNISDDIEVLTQKGNSVSININLF